MKKLYILLLIIGLAWMVKLSYDVFKISAQQDNLIHISHQLEKANSNLNDQLIALQRVDRGEKVLSTPQNIEQANSELLPNELIKQQLTLIEFAVKQQQSYYALDKLIELNKALDTYQIAPALKESLSKSIVKDIESLKKYISEQNEQKQIVQKGLQQLDLELKRELFNHHLVPVTKKENHFWQKWISIESVNEPATQLAQRALIIKEAQLRLMMARQILLSGEYAQYRAEINEIQTLLKQLPDQNTQKMIQQLESIKKISNLSYPVLTTRTLIG